MKLPVPISLILLTASRVASADVDTNPYHFTPQESITATGTFEWDEFDSAGYGGPHPPDVATEGIGNATLGVTGVPQPFDGPPFGLATSTQNLYSGGTIATFDVAMSDLSHLEPNSTVILQVASLGVLDEESVLLNGAPPAELSPPHVELGVIHDTDGKQSEFDTSYYWAQWNLPAQETYQLQFAGGHTHFSLTGARIDYYNTTSPFDAGNPWSIDDLPELWAGDADQDLDFDQMDVVRISQAGKYRTGDAATWGEGDWDGAPGGEPGNPPAGNGLFDQFDIIAAQVTGAYLTGPYAAQDEEPKRSSEQPTSVVYDPATGNLRVIPSAERRLTSISIESSSDLFAGERPDVLNGQFDVFDSTNVFKTTLGSGFGEIDFGPIAPVGLEPESFAAAINVTGSVLGGGKLDGANLVVVPEPNSLLLLFLSLIYVVTGRRSTNHMS